MNDLALTTLLIAQVRDRARVALSMPTLQMAQQFQPRQHGANTAPTVYMFKVGEHNHGSPQRRDRLNLAGTFDHELRQLIEAQWQFSAWIPQDPRELAALTASDVLQVIRAIMQSDEVIAGLGAQAVRVQRITDVRNPFIVDDRDRFAADPGFDVTLTHYRNLALTVPAVAAYEAQIHRV